MLLVLEYDLFIVCAHVFFMLHVLGCKDFVLPFHYYPVHFLPGIAVSFLNYLDVLCFCC